MARSHAQTRTMMSLAFAMLLALSIASPPAAAAAAGGKPAERPPMGWRSWNTFLLEVSQERMLGQVAALVKQGPGGSVSLLQAGYGEIGVDDGWQLCGAGPNGTFHDTSGNPLVNSSRFPDPKSMVAAARAQGVSMGWYMNNCWCDETGKLSFRTYDQDARFVVEAGFSGLKIDGCGPNHDIHAWTDAIARARASTGSPELVVENCGDNNNGIPPRPAQSWSPPLPSDLEGDKCTWQLYRVSKDIAPQFYSMVYNLQHTSAYNDPKLPSPLTRPGCWAYPDMLQVGRLATRAEDMSHFAAWCIVSSPLVLGFDLTNEERLANVRDIITNPRAIRINQAWAGDPGHLVRNSSATMVVPTAHGAGGDPECRRGCENVTLPEQQIWAKRLPSGSAALLFLNVAPHATTAPVKVTFADAGLDKSVTSATVEDVWTGRNCTASGSFQVKSGVAAHGNVFVTLAPSTRTSLAELPTC